MLYRRAAAAAYQKASLETSPIRILDALLGRLIQDIDDGRQAMEAKDVVAKNKAVDHALAIVGELKLALDRRHSEELCDRLESLYEFVESRLLQGSLKMDPKMMEEARPIVETIRGAFRDVLEAAA